MPYGPQREVQMTIASVLLPAILTSLSAGPARQTKPFTFVHITDTHIAAAARAAELRRFVGALSAPGGPSFVINTGDVTELGTDAEFDTYSAAVSDPGAPPVYAIPGNHDVRWAPLGKEAFTRRCGPLYRSFTHEGCHFVLLDSTVVLEHWGHFDGAQLAWLIRDLKKVGRHTPVFLFMHHWLGRTGTNIDNANDLLDIVAPYNVVAAFIGHGHSDLQWRVNGIECFMARGLYQGSHHTVSVRDGAVTVTRHSARPSGETATRLATIPISGRSRPRVDFRWDDAGTPLLARRRFTARLLDPAGKPVVASLRYALDGATARPPAAPEEVHPACEVDVSSCEPGWHNLTVELVTETGDRYERREAFLVDRLDAPVRMKWEQPTGSTIQGSPTLVGNTVYIGSFDGSVYAFDITTGRQLWRRATKGGVFCTPVVADGTVYVGSMDHFLYALDSRTGKVRWRK
ncbi:MAG: hypothetical protein FJX72_19840, partial [Armatimonadetes bacterium]|nr:hypothetical protein [Armatimonadota bacterium]